MEFFTRLFEIIGDAFNGFSAWIENKLTNMFGSANARFLKKLQPIVEEINAKEDYYKGFTDEELREMTPKFRKRLAEGETLDDILPDAFAVCREAGRRVLGMRHYDVQLIGGMVLHSGAIAEMITGEGKTLVATLPAYLNALEGKGVHVVTVNDYLARRDMEWMGPLYLSLGITVGAIQSNMPAEERQAAYLCDITYGTNNEFGFDYLRDNMRSAAKGDDRFPKEYQQVQGNLNFAIIDEVDNILIDEARTPPIISGQSDESTDIYVKVNDFVSGLKCEVFASIDEKSQADDDSDADYTVDEKSRSATLTAKGIAKAEKYFGLENLADIDNSTLSHHINQAVRAHGVMKRDIDYIVSPEGEIIIVDEFTGRLMHGRRYNEGLHQAIEAKEHVTVAGESKTLATITFQNYFRMYDKLSGMTGTALTEEEEFGQIYSLDIIEIPTNKKVIRIDHPDAIYKSEAGKYRAIINQIEECSKRGQPVLVGTVSIEKSEHLSSLLRKRGIKHNVLNAKNHEREAEIVAQAGKFGQVTIATNMAGRGTDIKLGGNPEYLALADLRKAGIADELVSEADGHADTDNEEIIETRRLFTQRLAEHKKVTDEEYKRVLEAGGLFIIGTERHESRRIDNQLRGRSGRQGDEGESRFYIAMTDDVMRLFGSERVINMMDTLKIDEDTPIDQKILSNAIENAQRKIESRNFQTRKNVLEYDDVMNTQRKLIYQQRAQVLDGANVKENILSMIRDSISYALPDIIEDEGALNEAVAPFVGKFIRQGEISLPAHGFRHDELEKVLFDRATAVYDRREQDFGVVPETGVPFMREVERVVLLRVVDEYWMEHIQAMEDLRDAVRLKAYAQTNPVDEYKRQGFDVFEEMIQGIKDEVTRRIFLVVIGNKQTVARKSVVKNVTTARLDSGEPEKKKPVKAQKRPGPNDPCWCGKKDANGTPVKYKKCHMDSDRLGNT